MEHLADPRRPRLGQDAHWCRDNQVLGLRIDAAVWGVVL